MPRCLAHSYVLRIDFWYPFVHYLEVLNYELWNPAQHFKNKSFSAHFIGNTQAMSGSNLCLKDIRGILIGQLDFKRDLLCCSCTGLIWVTVRFYKLQTKGLWQMQYGSFWELRAGIISWTGFCRLMRNCWICQFFSRPTLPAHHPKYYPVLFLSREMS